MPGVIAPATASDNAAALQELTVDICERALDGFLAMRRTEGDALGRELRARMRQLAETLDGIRELAPRVVEHHQQTLLERLRNLGVALPPDDERLAREIAIFADRCDISEELVRLDSHLEQCAELIDDDGQTGRKLDFLVQEMMREINTLGAKASDAAIAKHVVAAKAELDKMREQLQNVE